MARPLIKFGLTGASASRPLAPYYYSSYSDRPEVMDRTRPWRHEVDLDDLYLMMMENSSVRKSIQTLRDYFFKKGYEWEPEYSRQCNACGHKHDAESEPDVCEKCGMGDPQGIGLVWYTDPDENVIEECEAFFKQVDRNGHSLIDSLKIYNDHLEIADDSFAVVLQEYKLNPETGLIEERKVKEMFIADPRNFKAVQDPRTHIPGGRYFICLRHRPTSIRLRPYNYIQAGVGGAGSSGIVGGAAREQPGFCDYSDENGRCGMKLRDVWYVSHEIGSKDTPVEFFIGPDIDTPGEVIHGSKYSQSYLYGLPPGIASYNIARTQVFMETYVRRWYEEGRIPRAILWIPTRAADQIRPVLKEAEDRNVTAGGTYMPKIAYDPGDSGGRVPVTVTELSKPPPELGMMETHAYFTKRIAANWGVAPIIHGITDAAGLQNQGPTQWQVTQLAAEIGQAHFNDFFFPRLLEIMGKKGWKLKLKEVEEKNEMMEWQVKLAEAQYAQMMQMLGFPAIARDNEGHFEFPDEPQPMMMPGMMGGMPPGGGGGGPPPGEEPPPEEEEPPYERR